MTRQDVVGGARSARYGAVRARYGSLGALCGPIARVVAELSQKLLGFLAGGAETAGSHGIRIEPLESRQLLSAAWLDNGVLKVTGNSSMTNYLSVTVSGSNYVAHANSLTRTFSASSVDSIKIIGSNYGDHISVSAAITKPSYMEGWGGYDTISGGSGNDTILGGDGKDSILGNAGNDSLMGDAGDDFIDAGSGNDFADGGAGADTIRNAESSGVGPLSNTPSISSIQLWNSASNTFIENLDGGETIDLSKTPDVTLVVQANSTSSVKFGVDSNSKYRIENQAPYAIAGDFDGGKDLADWNVSTGSHQITITPYSSDNTGGSAGASRGISINVIKSGTVSSPPSGSLSISSVQLWNSSSNTFIEDLTGGETIDLGKTPKVSIVAKTSSSVRSVKFGVDSNSSYRIENQAPFAIAGDFDGGKDLADWNVSTGSHKITVTPYSSGNAGGTAGSSKAISLNVVKSSTPVSPPPPPSTPGDGIVPRDVSASAPNAVITAVSSRSIHAGQSIDVHAMNSSLNDGTPITARYLWDFGDPGSKYNVIEGFNASHFYADPGTYTVKLTLSNEAGKTDVATMTVTVSSASRKVYYVSPSGSDSNDGLSSSRPIRTWDKAISKLADNVEILFQGGQTFQINKTMSINSRNVVIGSYGSGKATLKWNGALNYSTIIYLGAAGTGGEDTVRDLVFDSIYTGTNVDGVPQAIGVASTGDTILNNTFLNLDYAVTTAPQPDGLLVQGNDAPLNSGLKEYFVWSQGRDIAVLGNRVVNTIHGHVVRSGGTDRLLIVGNDFSNPNDAYTGDNTTRGTLTIHKGNYVYISGNTLTSGKVNIGPLPYATDDKSARQRWNVFEDNIVHSEFFLDPGAEHNMVRNNVFYDDNDTAIQVAGFSNTMDRGVVDVTIANNTAVNNDEGGKFLNVTGPVNGISLVNNLYLAKNFAPGGSGGAAVFVYGTDLSSFTRITGNVWPDASPDRYAQGGVFYIWPFFSNQQGFKSPSEWDAYSQVSEEHYEDPSYNSSTLAPSTSSIAATASKPWAGVFEDRYGDIRPASGSWTAGAFQV